MLDRKHLGVNKSACMCVNAWMRGKGLYIHIKISPFSIYQTSCEPGADACFSFLYSELLRLLFACIIKRQRHWLFVCDLQVKSFVFYIFPLRWWNHSPQCVVNTQLVKKKLIRPHHQHPVAVCQLTSALLECPWTSDQINPSQFQCAELRLTPCSGVPDGGNP